MNTYSVPSTEHPQSSSACNERSAWGQKASEPRKGITERLTRNYWIAVSAGMMIPLIATFVSVLPLTWEGSLIVGTFIASVLFYIFSVMTELLAALKKAKLLWNEREEKIAGQNECILKLHEELDHFKALSFTKRGGLTVVKDDTAAGTLSCSDKHEGPAAVVPFTKTDGAA